MAENTKLTQLLEIADGVVKSWWLAVLGVSLGLVGASAALRYLPKVYEAETKIFVAPSRIPLEFVRSQGQDDLGMRVASLRESVLSRPYLLKVAAEVYHQDEAQVENSHLLSVIEGKLQASVLRIDEQRGAGVFQLSYRDSDPARAADAVNMLANLFIEENVKNRTAQAGTTTKVLDNLAQELRKQLDERERSIAAFKAQHLYDLADHMEANISMLQGRQRDLETNAAQIAQQQQRRELLLAQKRVASTAGAAPIQTPAGSIETPAARLARLKSELEAMRARGLSDAHPTVRAKQREIDEYAATMPHDVTPDNTAAQVAAMIDPLQAEIDNAGREIARLERERDQIKAEIGMLQRRIESTPQVEQQLAELSKGYDVLNDRYKNYQTSLENARGSQKVEEARQGEQFQVIERAVAPRLPVSPAPKIVYPAALVAGLVLCIGPLVAMMMLNPRIRSREGLRAMTEVPLLVSIGSLPTSDHRRTVWKRRTLGIMTTVVSLGLLIAAVLVLPR